MSWCLRNHLIIQSFQEMVAIRFCDQVGSDELQKASSLHPSVQASSKALIVLETTCASLSLTSLREAYMLLLGKMLLALVSAVRGMCRFSMGSRSVSMTLEKHHYPGSA